MNNIASLLLELIGINRQLIHISITDHFTTHFTGFAIIEFTIGIYALVLILQKGVAKNIERLIMLMIPNERNSRAITINKRVFHDRATIRAFHISSCSPTTEIAVSATNSHFEFPPYL